jgi:hypothetical protein
MPNVNESHVTLDSDFARKLGVRKHRVAIVGAPECWVEAFRGLPIGVWLSARKVRRDAGMFLIWLYPQDNLEDVFRILEARIPPDGAIWAVIPKKSALAKGEAAVEWHAMQAAGLASGRLVDNKELRFDDRYYGTRFVVRKEHR